MTARASGDPRRDLGGRGESEAESRLRDLGFRIAARRFRTRWGEIDLVAREGDVVVFVEVKTRSGRGFGSPAEAVTPLKQLRLARAAQAFLHRSGWGEHPCRFDVVEVDVASGPPVVRHIRDAFRPQV